MSLSHLKPGQFALKLKSMEIDVEKTSLIFSKPLENNQIEMTLKIRFTPDQIYSKTPPELDPLLEGIGDCGIFYYLKEHFDKSHSGNSIELTINVGSGEKIEIQSNLITIKTDGDKGQHSGT